MLPARLPAPSLPTAPSATTHSPADPGQGPFPGSRQCCSARCPCPLKKPQWKEKSPGALIQGHGAWGSAQSPHLINLIPCPAGHAAKFGRIKITRRPGQRKASHWPTPSLTSSPPVPGARGPLPWDCKGGRHVLPAPPPQLWKSQPQWPGLSSWQRPGGLGLPWEVRGGDRSSHGHSQSRGHPELLADAKETDPWPRKCHPTWLHAGSLRQDDSLKELGVAAPRPPLYPAALLSGLTSQGAVRGTRLAQAGQWALARLTAPRVGPGGVPGPPASGLRTRSLFGTRNDESIHEAVTSGHGDHSAWVKGSLAHNLRHRHS